MTHWNSFSTLPRLCKYHSSDFFQDESCLLTSGRPDGCQWGGTYASINLHRTSIKSIFALNSYNVLWCFVIMAALEGVYGLPIIQKFCCSPNKWGHKCMVLASSSPSSHYKISGSKAAFLTKSSCGSTQPMDIFICWWTLKRHCKLTSLLPSDV
jgi:hypothetical protein